MNEERLREILEHEVRHVDVSYDALPEIRRRIAARRWWLGRGFVGALGAGLAAAATVVALVVALGGPRPSTVPPPPVGGSPTAPAPTAPPSTTPSEGPAGSTASLRVFYLRVDRGQPRLYPEFHVLTVGDGSPVARTRAALEELFATASAYDPDYTTDWPAGVRVRDVRIEGDVATVDLTGVAGTPSSIAVQQVVWTVTAGGTAGVSTVRLLVDGATVAGPLPRAAAASVIGLIWLIDPQHGSTVGRSFQVHVAGIVFEATMRLRVRQGSTVVSDQTVMLDGGSPAQGEAFVPLTLAPGTYTIEGYEISAENGSEQHHDDHVITVR